jgi:hypothetical protein
MPHVILAGKVDLCAIAKDFQPHVRNDCGWITKLTDYFVAAAGNSALFEALAVAQGVTHNFFVRVEQKGDEVSVRIDPRTNVEKNDGVKRAVAIASAVLRHHVPSLSVKRTNLPQDILKAENLAQ